MLANIRAAGADEVIQHGPTWKDADTYLQDEVLSKAREQGIEPVYVPPFDHEDIWEGHSSMVDEMVVQLQQLGEQKPPDTIICSVGGGGLFNGVMQGVDRARWNETTVLAVETEGADSLNSSIRKGEHITLPGITSLATTLGATRVCDRTYELASTRTQVKSVVLSDAEAAMGSWRLADDERMMVELSCSVSVALCYGGRLAKALERPVKVEETVIIVLCGGVGVTVDMLSRWKNDFGNIESGASHEPKAVPSAAAKTNGDK